VSLVNTLFNRAQIALHLLDVRPRIGKSGTKTIDIRLQVRHFATNSPLIAIQQIHLLRVDTR
jgi:hypothetical protein